MVLDDPAGSGANEASEGRVIPALPVLAELIAAHPFLLAKRFRCLPCRPN
jgi:hypothetical protein